MNVKESVIHKGAHCSCKKAGRLCSDACGCGGALCQNRDEDRDGEEEEEEEEDEEEVINWEHHYESSDDDESGSEADGGSDIDE